jgi:hypothetical protein
MAFDLHFVPSTGGLCHWSCSYRTFEQLITAVAAERALGARDGELFVSCPEGLSPRQNEELLEHGVQFITTKSTARSDPRWPVEVGLRTLLRRLQFSALELPSSGFPAPASAASGAI